VSGPKKDSAETKALLEALEAEDEQLKREIQTLHQQRIQISKRKGPYLESKVQEQLIEKANQIVEKEHRRKEIEEEKFVVKRPSQSTDASNENPKTLTASRDNVHQAAQEVLMTHRGDSSLLEGKELVSFQTAEIYLGIGSRQRQKLMKDQVLEVKGRGQNKKITTESLKRYLPPEKAN